MTTVVELADGKAWTANLSRHADDIYRCYTVNSDLIALMRHLDGRFFIGKVLLLSRSWLRDESS